MTPDILLEIFGYFGTALVLLSFLMRDIKRLRVVNMAGGLVSLIYALCTHTMPVVVLNLSVMAINAFQLYRIIKTEKYKAKGIDGTTQAYNISEEKKEEHI